MKKRLFLFALMLLLAFSLTACGGDDDYDDYDDEDETPTTQVSQTGNDKFHQNNDTPADPTEAPADPDSDPDSDPIDDPDNQRHKQDDSKPEPLIEISTTRLVAIKTPKRIGRMTRELQVAPSFIIPSAITAFFH